jgi:hypothetical protein
MSWSCQQTAQWRRISQRIILAQLYSTATIRLIWILDSCPYFGTLQPQKLKPGLARSHLLTCGLARRYLSNHLVFGKAARFRHYPVTVNAERLALCLKPLRHLSWEGCRFSMKRKSGDRPDANLGLFNFDGRVEEHDHGIQTTSSL